MGHRWGITHCMQALTPWDGLAPQQLQPAQIGACRRSCAPSDVLHMFARHRHTVEDAMQRTVRQSSYKTRGVATRRERRRSRSP